jgi:hypothetical protein
MHLALVRQTNLRAAAILGAAAVLIAPVAAARATATVGKSTVVVVIQSGKGRTSIRVTNLSFSDGSGPAIACGTSCAPRSGHGSVTLTTSLAGAQSVVSLKGPGPSRAAIEFFAASGRKMRLVEKLSLRDVFVSSVGLFSGATQSHVTLTYGSLKLMTY